MNVKKLAGIMLCTTMLFSTAIVFNGCNKHDDNEPETEQKDGNNDGNDNNGGTTSLAAPTGLTLSQTSSYVKITWNKVDGASSYYVCRALPSDEQYQVIKETTSTSYIDYNVTAGTTYYYAVAAVNSEGYGNLATDEITFNGDGNGGNNGDNGGGESSTLPAPTGFTISQTSSSVILSWNKVNGAIGYAIYRTPSEAEDYLIDAVTSTSYTDNNVTAGITYYYIVAAVNSDYSVGEGADGTITFNGNSNNGNGGNNGGNNGGEVSKPNAPSGLTATASDDHITISWKAVSGATDYNVYRSSSASGNYYYLGYTSNTSYNDYSATKGTTFYYKVTALNSVGEESNKSSYVSAKISSSGNNGGGNNGGSGGGNNNQTKPSAPTGLKATMSSNAISLTWNAVNNATKYYIYRSTSNYGNYTLIDESYTNSYLDNSNTLKEGDFYYYKVSALNIAGESSQSSSAYCKYERANAPCDPKNVSVHRGYSQTVFKWEVQSGAGCGTPTTQTITFRDISKGENVTKNVTSPYYISNSEIDKYTNGSNTLTFILSLTNDQGEVNWLFQYDTENDEITHFEKN